MIMFEYPQKARISYGSGALSSLPDTCDLLGAQRVLLLTTRSLVDSSVANEVRKGLGDRCVAEIAGASQHVPEDSVSALLQQARDAAPDLVISLGGGSVTDTAKAISVGLAEGYASAQELYRHRIRFTYPDQVEVEPFKAQPLPIVAIPTTLSAAEYDGIFGVTSVGGVKELYSHEGAMPQAVILDPVATVETPERLWLATGIRTLDHAVETYLSRFPTPFTDALAIRSIELIAQNLPASRRNPEDMEARLNCLVSGWLSMFGVANVTLGLSHGIGHQVGAHSAVPHGETSCVMMPVVTERIYGELPERAARVVEALGVDVSSMTTAEAASTLPTVLREFIADLGLPIRLADVGVQKEDMPEIARAAMADMVVAFSPVTVTEEEVLELLQKAW